MDESRPTADQIRYKIASLIARRSTCSRLHVGALVHQGGRILVTGYNGTASGLEHCNHPDTSSASCTDAVHAEANCIAWAARVGIQLSSATMVVTHSPCRDCAKLIISAGLKQVEFGEYYRDTSPLGLLTRGHVAVKKWGPLS